MKREELKALGLDDTQIEGVMKINNVEVEANKVATEKLTTQVATLKAEKKDANDTITKLNETVKGFDGSISKEELDAKIKEHTDAYESKLASKDKDYATDKLFSNKNFSSNLAKNAAIQSFKDKELKFEDGKFLGADDFFKSLKESDPTAFKEEGPNKPNPLKLNGNVGGQAGDPNKSMSLIDAVDAYYE